MGGGMEAVFQSPERKKQGRYGIPATVKHWKNSRATKWVFSNPSVTPRPEITKIPLEKRQPISDERLKNRQSCNSRKAELQHLSTRGKIEEPRARSIGGGENERRRGSSNA
ncbi:hypothetical protein ACLOJK_001854 [Asimina triloba]